MSFLASAKITAVLGPTNTGKTYLAMERMLGYSSGMIGFPLRLLARENYDKAVAIKGASKCALVTGEEKILPKSARYFFCTVESMPVDKLVEFLAVDEIQLAADEERGHIFTDRLLNARGTAETMFMGSSTIAPILKKLVRDIEFIERPRFSNLSFSGSKKIVRLPPRSAVVAFSATDVYQLAETIRQHRGGTAVVLGALSPRTRNAQVELFENGDVDYLVATDAIGMGLNLDVNHVAFSRMEKFDGRISRYLYASEVGQIAGRAGRHTRDGTFGTTNNVGPLDDDLIARVENHDYDPLRVIYWRNADLDYRSPEQLIASLERRADDKILSRVRDAEDHQALMALAQESTVQHSATNPSRVKLLWEVCQVPDFRKILTDQHIRLLSQIYHYLMSNHGVLPEDWIATQIKRIDRIDGDIDTLVSRISHIRTWTYISHRSDWIRDNEHWQGVSRAIEDRLSDALHERLTQRFVDRRAAKLVRSLRAGENIVSAVKANGDVIVEGELLGRIVGFSFVLDESLQGSDIKPGLTAARKTLLSEMPARVSMLEEDNDGSFLLNDSGELTWRGIPVGKLIKGESSLNPAVDVYSTEFIDSPMREKIRLRLVGWLERHLRAQLKPLFYLSDAKLEGTARGIAFQVIEGLGLVPRYLLRDQINGLSKADRKALADLGLRLGRESVFLPNLNRPRPSRIRALLWAAWNETSVPELPDFESKYFTPSDAQKDIFCASVGYRHLSNRKGRELVLRADVLERISHEAYKLLRLSKDDGEKKSDKKEADSKAKVVEIATPAVETPIVDDTAVTASDPKAGSEVEVKAVDKAESEAPEAKKAEDDLKLPAGSFVINDEMRKVSGLDDQQIAFVLKSLRFHPNRLKGGITAFGLRGPKKQDPRKKEARKKQVEAEKARMADSPFAVLQDMSFKR
ncbi:disulfide oxidoreductase [Kiloniella litopenaei]|uniref:Disulfide oxidoreductase n=1 Tax=Kiloniella litopenaei TaxID=1549748 RepID=A0A0M2RDD7_9PROT|nr:helicase-related protein [Kiloniella litopenaei]KKJ78020.1 disulfide oxidoreductase [Kiloniella litopenaei]